MTTLSLDQQAAFLDEALRRGFGPKGNRRAPSLLAPYHELVEHGIAVNETLIKRHGAVMRDSNLSREGREKALATLGKESIRDFSWIGEKLTKAQEARARWKAACLDYMTKPKGNEVVQEAREREVRDIYRVQPQPDRDMAFFRAAEQLDAETMRGLQGGPGGPWITGEGLSRGEQLYAERRNPELYIQWQEIDVLIEHIEGLATFAFQVLLTLTGGTERPAILKALGLPPEKGEEGLAHV